MIIKIKLKKIKNKKIEKGGEEIRGKKGERKGPWL